jgi:hypothetical protein
MTTKPTVQSTIAAEIRSALVGGAQLSSAELLLVCPTAEDVTAVSRVIYDLRNNSFVAACGERPGPGGRGGNKPIRIWHWIGPADAPVVHGAHRKAGYQPRSAPSPRADSIEDEAPSTRPALRPTPSPTREPQAVAPPVIPERPPLPAWTETLSDGSEPTSRPAPQTDSADPTEMALCDLLDQADEALLCLADNLLSEHPVWTRMRRLADDAHGALCDYRLLRSMEDAAENGRE